MIEKKCKKSRHWIALFAVLAFLGLPGPDALGAPSANTVMVIDASRSMWGQIDGVNKVVILQNALSKTFKQFDGRTNLGLVAYGHRREAGCTDIELVRPLGLLKSADYSAVVRKIRPKGSTPISNALQLAAKSASAVPGDASVILISDGLDNCRGNPCGVASDLKKKLPGLKIHVVAFDRKDKEELKSLSCISQATGGSFSSATSEAELQDALTSVMTQTISDPMVVASVKPREVVAPSVPLASSWGTTTSSISREGSIPPSERASRENLAQIAQAVAQQGNSVAKSSRTVTGRTPVTFVARLNEGGQPISTGIIWRVFETKPTSAGEYRLVSTHRDAAPIAVLNPGDYLVNAAYGRAHLTKKVSVAQGQAKTEEFVMNAGGLRLNAVLGSGGQISSNNVTYTIYSDEQDQFGEREKVLSNARPGLVIRLNSGIYHVVSQYGNANAVVKADVTVTPGKLTEATINHQAGRVTFKLVLQPGGEALANTQWRIITQAGDTVKKSAGALPSHILASGEYSVVAKHSGRDYILPFVVQSGDNKQVEVVVR